MKITLTAHNLQISQNKPMKLIVIIGKPKNEYPPLNQLKLKKKLLDQVPKQSTLKLLTEMENETHILSIQI